MTQIVNRKRLTFLGPDFKISFLENGSTGKPKPDPAFTNRLSVHLHHHLSAGLCGSDHIPIIARISTNSIAIPVKKHYSYARANWEAFSQFLENTHTQPILKNGHHTKLDTTLNDIHNAIINAADALIPKTQLKIHHSFTPSIHTQRLTICYRIRFERNKHHHTRLHRDINTLR